MTKTAQRLFLELSEQATQEELGCRQFPDAFFMTTNDSDDFVLNKLAISICRNCPIKDLCLAYAVEAKERFGIWGGTTPAQRKRLKVSKKLV